MMQLSIFDLPPAPEPVIAPDLLAEQGMSEADQRELREVARFCEAMQKAVEIQAAEKLKRESACGVCFDCPGTLTGQSWQCAVNPDHRALVDLAALGRDLPANWIRGNDPDPMDTVTLSHETDVLMPVAVGIEGSACNFCGSPMVKHHPDLPVWRCTADEWHRFWLSKDGEGRKAKRIGVWLGHSRADPGSGPGEIPEWAK